MEIVKKGLSDMLGERKDTNSKVWLNRESYGKRNESA